MPVLMKSQEVLGFGILAWTDFSFGCCRGRNSERIASKSMMARGGGRLGRSGSVECAGSVKSARSVKSAGSVKRIEIAIVANLRLGRNIIGRSGAEVDILRRVELQLGSETELAERLFGSGPEDGENSVLVGKLHLGLRGMDVDIDACGVDLQHQEIAGIVTVGDEVAVGLLDGCAECGVLDKATIDKKILLAACLLHIFAFAHIALHADHLGLLLDGVEPFLIGVAVELGDTLCQVAGLEIVKRLPVASESEPDRRVHQHHPFEDLFDMAQLDAFLLEKIATSGEIIEKILDRERSA